MEAQTVYRNINAKWLNLRQKEEQRSGEDMREVGTPGAEGVNKRREKDDGYDPGKGPVVPGARGSHREILNEDLRSLILKSDLSKLHN